VAYQLSLRHIEEMMQERGVFVDHVAVHRWAIKDAIGSGGLCFERRKRPCGSKLAAWTRPTSKCRASGNISTAPSTVTATRWIFLLTAKRDLAAAPRFLERAINLHDVPEKISIDKSGANTAAIESVKADACVDILMRQSKYLNNMIEQDHRAVKRITRPMMGFKSFWSARIIIGGIETMHKIKKGQMNCPVGPTTSAADQFYELAF
jgi:putative transposase